MYWLALGLVFIGAVCGATVRLMVFVGVLVCAAVAALSIAPGWGAAALNAVIAVVALQIGYAAGFVLRAAIRSWRTSNPPRVGSERPIPTPVEGKHR